MKTNKPYRATAMSPIKPMSELPNKGEYTGHVHQGSAGKSCMPSKGASPKASMIDGPYGGKKPA